jgi:hypothetical protein
MNRALIPYYVSRAILSALFGYVISTGAGVTLGASMGALTFVGFLWYAHNGRDDRGSAIRDRAVVTSVAIAGVTYAALGLLSRGLPIPLSIGWLAIVVGVVSYFVVSNWLFMKR